MPSSVVSPEGELKDDSPLFVPKTRFAPSGDGIKRHLVSRNHRPLQRLGSPPV
jgi:hypothetical protein